MFAMCCSSNHVQESECEESAAPVSRTSTEESDVCSTPSEEASSWASSEPEGLHLAAPDCRADSKASTASTAAPRQSDACETASADIVRMPEADVFAKYKPTGRTIRSVHRGVNLMFATRVADGLEVVLKVFNKAMIFGSSAAHERRWRAQAVLQLALPKSERLCELIEVIDTEDRYFMVMEKVEGKDLAEWESIDHADAREIMKQVLQAVHFMHSSGYIHRDLKLDNVVAHFDSKVSAILIDFDTAAASQGAGFVDKQVTGTYCYSAPETFKGHYSTASDMYSVGVMMYRLLTSCSPVPVETFDAKLGEAAVGSQPMNQIHKRLASKHIDFSLLDACPEAASLCKSLLAFEPEKRLSAEEALSHEWFALGTAPVRALCPKPPAKTRFAMLGKGK